MADEAQVSNNEDKHRFELVKGGATAFAEYDLSGDTITFTHTIVPEELEGQGIGSRLVAGALDESRSRGLSVVPRCSFVRHFIDTHPDYQPLLAQ
jgi:predicted GNAT family acetyltransferase